MISFQNVTKRYPKNKDVALQNVTFNIDKGEFVFLTGVSGSGKTTLLKLLYKAEVPSNGKVMMFNKDIKKFKKTKLRRKMGIVFQDYLLLKDKSVYDNVAYPLACLGVNPLRVKKETMEALKKLNIEELAKKFPQELSGGQQQRVAIARAMVNKPELLICDEPTGNLDSENAWIIMDHLKELNDGGMTIIMTTHSEEILKKETHRRVINLERGSIKVNAETTLRESGESESLKSSFEFLDKNYSYSNEKVVKNTREQLFLLDSGNSNSDKTSEKLILEKMGWTEEDEEQHLIAKQGRE